MIVCTLSYAHPSRLAQLSGYTRGQLGRLNFIFGPFYMQHRYSLSLAYSYLTCQATQIAKVVCNLTYTSASGNCGKLRPYVSHQNLCQYSLRQSSAENVNAL